MRILVLSFLFSCLAVPAWHTARAEPGTEPVRVTRASALDPGKGVVVISIRSEIYLDEPLDVFFLREGGSVDNAQDVVVFERRQGFFAFGNDTVKYKVRTYQLPVGTYRLVAHGIECPKVPAEDERCLVDVSTLGVRETLARPSRGYGDIAPRFEVREGEVTYAGDFALTARNLIEWSQVPSEELRRVRQRFSALPISPEPIIPGEFRLRYGLNPRSYEDDANRRF